MKIRFPGIFVFCAVSLTLLLLVSCGPVTPAVTETSISTATFTPAYSLTLTAEAAMTMAMSETPPVTPSFTPPAGVTVNPVPGDLGWGAVHGKIFDGVTHLPLEGATVKCEHSSYTSPSPCNAITATNADGIYSFLPVFFHDTDRITLFVEAPGYMSARFEQSFFTQPDLQADIDLFPSPGDTPAPTPTRTQPTPLPICTAQPCPGGGFTCNGICPTATPTPILMCTPPPCSNGTFTCGNSKGCPGGCGTICLPATAKP